MEFVKLKAAAKQGIADMQYCLGVCYQFGYGVEKNEAQAVYWWRKAAKQGYADAQYALGVCYYLGQGVTEDYKEAKKWLWKFLDQFKTKEEIEKRFCQVKLASDIIMSEYEDW